MTDEQKEKGEESYIQKSRGCNAPSEVGVKWFNDEDDFWNCPIKFISQGVYEFLEKYDAYKSQLATPPDYEKQAAKFWEGVKALESYLVKFHKQQKGE